MEMEATEQLRADLKANLKNLKTDLGSLATTQDVCKHLRDTLWPFLESIVDNVEELDEGIIDLAENSGDMLQPDSAAGLKTTLAGSVGLVAQLRMRLKPDWQETPASRQQMEAMLLEHEKALGEAIEFVDAVTVVERDDDDDDEDEGDEDDTAGSKDGDK